MNTLHIRECLAFGWATFKKRPWLFVGAACIIFAAAFLIGFIEGLLEMLIGKSAVEMIDMFVSIAVNVLVSMGILTLYLGAHDDVLKPTFLDLWQPRRFLPFLGMTLVASAAIILGLIALIVPGIIIGIAFSFAGLLMMERDLGPIKALKESVRLTRGHRFALFKLGLVSALLNVLGLLACLIGIFVTVPVTMLAFVHAYRQITRAQEPEGQL